MKSRIYVILAFIVIACNNQENSISREELVIRQVEVFFASLGKIEKVKNGVTLTAGFYDLDEVINEVNKILCNNGFKPSISDFDLEQLSSQVGRTKKTCYTSYKFYYEGKSDSWFAMQTCYWCNANLSDFSCMYVIYKTGQI